MFKRKSEPIIVQENLRENGELRSLYQLIDKNARKPCLIHKYWLMTCTSMCCFILLTLVASLVVVYFAHRDSLYKESCLMKNCVKGFDLKCINGTCVCDTGYSYIDKCRAKKNYMEQCHLTSHCKDNLDLVCRNGLCECKKYYYWNGTSCVSELLYGKPCTNDSHCITDRFLFCDKSKSVCTCDSVNR